MDLILSAKTIKGNGSSTKITPDSAIKITIQNTVVNFTDIKQSLLECLESADIEVHYHCRDGFCGACRVTLVEGDIFYPDGEPLAYIGEGEILACCCLPISDITLEID